MSHFAAWKPVHGIHQRGAAQQGRRDLGNEPREVVASHIALRQGVEVVPPGKREREKCTCV